MGSGRYASLDEMKACHEASATQMVTVAMRRLDTPTHALILDGIDQKKIHLLPNTSGASTAAEALRYARIAVELGATHLKIEITGDLQTLLPDPIETLRAVELICETADTKNLFLMVYTSDDIVMARRLFNAGAGCIMPLARPIGSGRGLANETNLMLMLEMLKGQVPVIVDAGIGRPSHAARAMELGADGVLLNTAIAKAEKPIKMAEAMKHAVIAGRYGYLGGTIPAKMYATASSPS